MLPALKRPVAPLLALLLAAAPLAAREANRNVRFGLPVPAKAEPPSREAFLIARPQYVLSSDAEKRIPNWVCWGLKAGDTAVAALDRRVAGERPERAGVPAGPGAARGRGGCFRAGAGHRRRRAGRGQCPGGGAGRWPDGAGRPVPPHSCWAGRTTSVSPSPWSHAGHLAARPLGAFTRR
jgi:hypothetical protein